MSFRSVAIVAVASVGLLWLTFRASAPWDGTPVEVPRSGEPGSPGSPVRTVDGPSGPGHPELKQMGEEQVVHSTTQTVEMSGEVFHLSPKSLRERVEHPSPRDDAGPELDDPREKRSDEKTSDAMRQCVLDTKVFPEKSEVDAIVRVLLQPRDLSQRDEPSETRIPLPLVFTQIPKYEGVSIAEAFHHAWSSFGCGKMFFTKSDVRIRTGRKTCFTLWAGSEGGKHLYPWGFFDSRTRRQDVPDLERLIGLRGYLPFGACRFLAPGCSYATVLLDPVARYLTHVHWECTHGHPFKECESLAEYTHKAIRGQVGFYGIDNYQTRMLAGDGAEDPGGAPCFVPERCHQQPLFEVHGPQLRQAIHNLAFHYAVWGLLDDLRAFAHQVAKVYGYFLRLSPAIAPELGNFSMDLVDAQVRKEIEEMNGADLILYHFVRCVLAAGGPRFQTP
ncbi:unnamed protein product [Durusdinium trenchii]|uniref:Uncharacterized protein n=3 Tax=Durusdinium trenchii TaxID=1381693 RepID=A0ABP0QIG8_9DINO